MQKSTQQAPNPPITRSDIFGADDTSDEDVVKHSGEPGTDRKRRKLKRMRLTEQQKIDITLHSHKNPQLTQQDLIAWSKHKFSLQDPVSSKAKRKAGNRMVSTSMGEHANADHTKLLEFSQDSPHSCGSSCWPAARHHERVIRHTLVACTNR